MKNQLWRIYRFIKVEQRQLCRILRDRARDSHYFTSARQARDRPRDSA